MEIYLVYDFYLYTNAQDCLEQQPITLEDKISKHSLIKIVMTNSCNKYFTSIVV